MEHATAQGMVGAALAELCAVVGLEGAAVIDMTGPAPSLLYVTGAGVGALVPELAGLLAGRTKPLSRAVAAAGHPVMVCPWTLPPNRAGGLAMWRAPSGRTWTARDSALAAMGAAMVRVMLEHGPDESGIDRLTGLPNRLYFLEEADRHIERLTQDATPGTLMVVELDGLDQLALAHGTAARDWMLVRVGALIRAMVRPTDLVGRVGGGTFAVWLDGMDHMTAAERAEDLCGRRLYLPEAPGREVVAAPPLSIGIACRTPGSEEDARGLMLHAREAASLVGHDGGGWHVWRPRH